jgi:hypothetical protein
MAQKVRFILTKVIIKDENFKPRIFEQHNKMDWTQELKKIIDKYKIGQGSVTSLPYPSYKTNSSQQSVPPTNQQQ